MRFMYADGGRAAAEYRGQARDCVCRAIAPLADLPYVEIYEALNALAATDAAPQRPLFEPYRGL